MECSLSFFSLSFFAVLFILQTGRYFRKQGAKRGELHLMDPLLIVTKKENLQQAKQLN